MKNWIFNVLIAFALVFGACSKDQPVLPIEEEPDLNAVRLANSECEYTVHSDGLAAVVIDGRLEYVTRFVLVDDYGNTIHAYCANMEAPCYDGARYKCASADDYFKNGEETKIIAALTYIMNRYGWMETTNPQGFTQMIQSVIWRIIHGYEVTYVDNDTGNIIRDVINYIYDHLDDISDDYHSGVTMKEGDAAVKDGLFVNYGPYQISENTLLADVDFHLTFDQNDVNAQFVNDAGTEITMIKPEESFYLRVSHDVAADLQFTATASTSEELWYVNDFQFFVDVRAGNYQQLFRPVMSNETLTFFYSCTANLTVTPTEPEPDPDPEPEKITLTELCWNNGTCGGINRFTVNGITLKSSKNYVLPTCFDVLITKTPGKKDETAIYTVIERIVKQSNGCYIKIYEIKVALYSDGVWKVYSGAITVDNKGGNNNNQQIDLERIL